MTDLLIYPTSPTILDIHPRAPYSRVPDGQNKTEAERLVAFTVQLAEPVEDSVAWSPSTASGAKAELARDVLGLAT